MSIKVSKSGPVSGIDEIPVVEFFFVAPLITENFYYNFLFTSLHEGTKPKERNIRKNDVRAGSSPWWNITEIQYNVTTRSVSLSSSVPPAPPCDAFL